MADLEYLLAQARRVAEHREQGAEVAIRKEFTKLLQDLRGFVANTYSDNAVDGILNREILQQKGRYANFIEVVQSKVMNGTAAHTAEIKKVVEETYNKAYESMEKSVDKAGGDLKKLKKELPDNMVRPGAINRSVKNTDIHKLTLSDNLEDHRAEIIRDIKKTVTNGLQNGDRYEDMAGKIAETVDGDYKKAVRIARTECHRVREGGNLDAAIELDKKLQASDSKMRMYKTWRTGKDSRVRRPKGKNKANHVKMEGVTIPVQEYFKLPDGVKTMAPGQSGDAGNDINCRCYLTFKMQETDLESDLKNDIENINAQIKELEGRKYAGIWRDDVTVGDYPEKAPKISAKKDYFKLKFDETGDEKYSNLLMLTDQYAQAGQEYIHARQSLYKAKKRLEAFYKNNGLTTIKKVVDDRFSQERKDAAYWFKDQKPADNVLRQPTFEKWRNMTESEKKAAYDYTAGSGGFNRPLRGFKDSWYNNVGVGNVDIDNEGRGAAIRYLTKAIDNSTYDFDIWLQRGIESAEGLANFTGLDVAVLERASEAELQSLLVGNVVTDTAFVSTGAMKGAGFNGAILNIYAPSGTKMLYCEPFSAFGGKFGPKWNGETQSFFGHEFEMLLQRNTSFKVIKLEKKYGQIYMDLEVVEQSPTPL